MSPPTPGSLASYLCNALRCPAAAVLLKPIADALAPLLGTDAPGGTAPDLAAALDTLPDTDANPEPLERNARFATAEFDLSDVERDILLLALRVRRNRALSRFCAAVQTELAEGARTIAAVLDRDLEDVQPHLAPGSRLRSCGLIVFEDDEPYGGFTSVLSVGQPAAAAMLGNHPGRDAWREALLGRPCAAGLPWDCFDHLGPSAALAVRVLAEAVATGAVGIHVMLAGPPGTGKTAFAQALATRAGLALYAAGEQGHGPDDEPSRAQRGNALRLSLALLKRRLGAAVLMDEAEDVLDGARSFGAQREAVSKVFLNRMLERSPVPVLWTCNETDWMDPATLRRMTLVVRMPVPGPAQRAAIWRRVLDCEALPLPAGTAEALAARWPVSAGLAAGAARAARLAGGGLPELETALAGVAEAVGLHAVGEPAAAFDPELTVCTADLAALCARLARPGAPRDWSLCLSGPPGTGKSAFARHLADRLGLPVLVKRASDLLSMWVGGSEQAIAAAFAQARAEGALLLIDEAEALLFDRGAASRAFEVSQVNEMLTWMERHPLPFVCTTNMAGRMDAAVPRRFTLKLRLEALDPVRAGLAFRRLLGAVPPGPLPAGLTQGDFALVRRKAELLGETRPSVLAAWLDEELAAEGEPRDPIGFQPAARALPKGLQDAA